MVHPSRRYGRLVLLGIAVALVGVAVWGYLRVMKFDALTTSGRVYAARGLETLAEGDLAAGENALRQARSQFQEARGLLGPQWLRTLPWAGRQLQAADDLCSLVVDGSSAGIEVARLMARASSARGPGRLTRLLGLAPVHLDPALAALARVADRSAQLTTDGLAPPLAAAVAAAKRPLAQVQPLLQRSHALLDLERRLFAREHRFLVVTQDSAELQPTGGSMVTYGLVTFGSRGFILNQSATVSSLPEGTLKLSSPPGRERGGRLTFRDANWWMDFPTSASRMAQFWADLRQPQIDGIIAVDVPMIQRLLEVYGPLRIPESQEPLTAGNLMQRLLVDDRGEPTTKQQRAKAVISLTTELVDSVTNLNREQLLPTLEALKASADQKHLQIYLLDPDAQADVVTAGWAGALDPPPGTTDLLGVSNGDVEPSKANLGVTKSLAYRVRLLPDGGANGSLTLRYRKERQKLVQLPDGRWANYVRAHRLPGTELAPKSAGVFRDLPDATGMPTFGHFMQLRRGSSEVVLHTRLPQALRSVTDAAAEGPTWQYRLFVAKQADLADTRANVRLEAAPGWRVLGATAHFRGSGRPVQARTGTGAVAVATPLEEDLVLEVTLARADSER